VLTVVTPVVVTVTDAELAPAGIVNVGGIAAAELSLESSTNSPFEAAFPTRYAVANAEVEPATAVGLTVKLSRAGCVLTPVASRI
jgi:hypothetical protein